MSTEFVKQTMRENLARVLVPHVADGLWSIYDNAKTACERNQQPEMTLRTFQNLLTRIPQWSDDVLNKEVERIEIASKCDYIDDLLLGAFVSYIRAFASLQQTDTSHVHVEFNKPSLSKFVHEFYKLSARKSWTQAYLFKTIGVSSEQQARNRRDIETMLEGALSEVIDGFIPWREISKAYFHAAAPAPAPSPAPTSAPVTFGEPEVHEFETETDDEEEEEEDGIPHVKVGEDVKLDDIEGDADSVDTEAELTQKAEKETISLNL